MKQSFFLRALVAAVLVLVIFAGFGDAQSTKGTIAGVVTDKSGAVVTGATVTATAAGGGDTRTVTTGGNGEYRIEPLTPGDFIVTVTAPGFATTKIEGVVVRTSIITSNNVILGVASGSETVTVEASADTIQTETGELSKTISPDAIKDLPYSSQNPYSLAVTLPGVTTVASRDSMTNGTGFSVNGLRPRSNNFLIDGFDNNDGGIAGQAFQPNNTESVQEVTVLTNSYAAEFGRGGGSVSNLSFKSGTNTYHGAVWEQYSGAGLDAVTWENRSLYGINEVPQYVNNTFGFRLGGPIKKDKMYFFGTGQWSRYFGDPGASSLLLPTANGINTLKSIAAGGNQQAQLMLNALGGAAASSMIDVVPAGSRAGCVAPCNVEYGFYKRTDKGKNLSREYTGRFDYTGVNDNLYVRYTDGRNDSNPDLFANSGALPYADTKQGGPSRIFGTMWAHTFSPRVLNEFRFSAQQIDFTFDATDATLAGAQANMPTMYLGNSMDFFWGGYSQSSFPQGRGHKTFQFQDAMSMTLGGHNIKLGADMAVLLIQDQVPFNANGLITYNTGGDCSAIGANVPGEGCSDLANYLDNYSGPNNAYSKSFGNPRQNIGTNQQAYYFQDSWKLRSNLSLDLGLRYEYQPYDSLNSLLYPAVDRATFATDALLTRKVVKTPRNSFAPRFGFAYTPTFWKGLFGEQKTVLRGGYGMFYDPFFTNISNNVASGSPNANGISGVAGQGPAAGGTLATDRGMVNPLQILSNAAAVPDPIAFISSVDSNLRSPRIHQWNMNVQRELPLQLKAEVAYVGTRGQHLWLNEQLNPRNTTSCTNFSYATYRCAVQPRDVTTRGSISVRSNRGDSVYHGLQTSLTRNVGSVQVRGSYTWSKAIDNQSEVFASSGGASRWMNVRDPRSDRGVSAFDRTHRAAISYSYNPSLPWKKGVLGAIFSGWENTGVISFQSGVPETIYLSGWDQNGDGETTNDRPVLGNKDAALNLSSACLASPTCISGVGFVFPNGTMEDWNTGAAGTADQFRYLIYPANSGVQGTVGRNSFRYPGTYTYDTSISKAIKMPYKEGHQVQLRMDLINAFNHKNLGVSGFAGNLLNTSTFLNEYNTRRGGRSIVLWAKYTF